MDRISRRHWLRRTVPGLLAGISSGCGTILYPERRGQPAGPIDWKIVAFDAVGLVFFFVPGVVAFAVDFATGAIYLPPEQCTQHRAAPRHRIFAGDQELCVIVLSDETKSLAAIEQLVSRETQSQVRLQAGNYESQPLDELGKFWSVQSRLERIWKLNRASAGMG